LGEMVEYERTPHKPGLRRLSIRDGIAVRILIVVQRVKLRRKQFG
jgi:hypothetical protein